MVSSHYHCMFCTTSVTLAFWHCVSHPCLYGRRRCARRSRHRGLLRCWTGSVYEWFPGSPTGRRMSGSYWLSVSLWNFVSISSRSGVISTSGFDARHIVFPASAYVGQCREWWKWVPGPRKPRHSRWNFVSMSSRSRYISTSGFGGRHFDF